MVVDGQLPLTKECYATKAVRNRRMYSFVLGEKTRNR
ncbi:hypothetical protein QO008_000647 [Peptoniphilus ivorii]|nr:hypothetical protein [Peptoniphilus ivorii]